MVEPRVARNALLDETRSALIEPGLPFLAKFRVAPSVRAVLAREKTDVETWGDFALLGMLALAISRRTVRGDFSGVNRLLVGLVGENPTGVGSPHEPERRPLAKAGAR